MFGAHSVTATVTAITAAVATSIMSLLAVIAIWNNDGDGDCTVVVCSLDVYMAGK